jgi:hypothetical protein
MIDRIVAGLAGVLLMLSAATAPASASPAAAPAPAAEPCVTVTLDGMRGVYRPDSDLWEPWFDATVAGRSRACGGGAATLAVTQYHVRDGATIGLMSTPWTAAAQGTTAFSRFGRIRPDVAALCVSTGLTSRDGAVVARHAACVRPVRTGTDHLVTRFAPVRLTDPLVNAALSEHPADGVTPTGPLCPVNCLVSPYVHVPGSPWTTRDTPISEPAVPLEPYESECHTIAITDTFAGPSDDPANGYDVWMTGAVDACPGVETLPQVHAIRYWSDRGIVMEWWDHAQWPLAKSATVNENTAAICLATGMRERGGRLYGVHDLCWKIVKDRPDRYLLVPIRTDDPRVRKPLQSNMRVPDPEYPPGVCASCL